MINLTITKPDAGVRFDTFLKKAFGDDWTRSQITNAISCGRILLNNEIVKSGKILRPGDQVTGDMTSSDIPAEPEDIPLNVIFENSEFMIINKPRGMVVHPGAGVRSGTLLNALLFKGFEIERAGIVHRLDKNTAGLMVVAKTAKTQAMLAKMFEFHDVKRTYIGIIEGRIDTPGTINKNITRHPGARTIYTTCPPGRGRTAITHYKPLRQFKNHTLVQFQLETGRTHQIRVHMKSINRPLVGDPEYNPKSSLKASGQMLEAVCLEFLNYKFNNEPSQEFSNMVNLLDRLST